MGGKVAQRLIGVLLVCGGVLIPTAQAGNYGYGYYYPQQAYYYTPSYTYYAAEYRGNRFWPAGDYYSLNGLWYLRGHNGPFYGYDYAPPAPAYAPPAVPAVPYGPNWQVEGLRTVEKLNDLAAWSNFTQKLGQFPNFGGNYGQAGYGGGYATPNLGAYGVNGNSLYGYSVKQIAEAYGTTDLNVLYQQSARLAQGAQGLGGQATTDFMALVKQAGDGSARSAEQFARGMAIAAAIQAAGQATAVAPGTRTTTVVQGNGSGNGLQQFQDPPPQPLQPAAVPQQVQAFLTAVAVPQCGRCHSGADPKGKFNVAALAQLDGEGRAVVLERVLTADPDSGMPRDASGKHAPLSKEQKRLWLKFLIQ